MKTTKILICFFLTVIIISSVCYAVDRRYSVKPSQHASSSKCENLCYNGNDDWWNRCDNDEECECRTSNAGGFGHVEYIWINKDKLASEKGCNRRGGILGVDPWNKNTLSKSDCQAKAVEYQSVCSSIDEVCCCLFVADAISCNNDYDASKCSMKLKSECTTPSIPCSNFNAKCDTGGSCPFLYSATEDGDKMEEDILLMQFSSKVNRPYYTKLDNYDRTKNQIKVKELLDETTYVGSLKLIGAKHDGTAMINGEGKIVTVNSPLEVECKSKLGDDCTEQVKAMDAQHMIPRSIEGEELIDTDEYGKAAYSTNIKNINLEDENTYQDYVELTLPPTDQKEAKLIVSFSVTPQIVNFEGRVAEDIKNILPLVYHVLEQPLLSSLVNDQIIKTGYAKIMVQDGNGDWMEYSQDFNSKLDPGTNKETVVLLDMPKVRNNKVRIVFLSGTYAFDYIAVDYSKNKLIITEEIPILKATDNKGDNVKEQLVNKDSNYVVLSKGEAITVEFDNSEKTTYFIESTGYYQPGTNKNIINKASFDTKEAKLLLDILLQKNFAEKYVLNLVKG
jgi:hypothetical protein